MSTLIINDARNKAKLYLQQGSELTLTFDLSEFTTSLVGATGRGQIRRTASSNTIEAEFDCSVDSGAETMTATLAAADSTAMVLDASDEAKRTHTVMAYDIELVFSDDTPVRLLWGEVEIIPEVTRDAAP